jgi:N6-adenosine-specific RNA methylase IME4
MTDCVIAFGQAQEVARAWGFKPISEIVWLKRYPRGKARIGIGYRVRTCMSQF